MMVNDVHISLDHIRSDEIRQEIASVILCGLNNQYADELRVIAKSNTVISGSLPHQNTDSQPSEQANDAIGGT